MRRPLRILALIGFLAATLGLAAGCSDSSAGSGTLQMNMVDAPSPIVGLEAIDVVFDSVRVHKSGQANPEDKGWITVLDNTLPEAERTFDLFDLVNGNFAVLGLADLSAGKYTQIRVIVESAAITIAGNTDPLTIPSGMQTGIKIVSPFTVVDGEVLELLLDFDAAQSVSSTRLGYTLDPVIRVVQADQTGSIAGTVTAGGFPSGPPVVSAYEAGTTTLVTTTYVDDTTGEYELEGLEPGDYDLTVDALDAIDTPYSGSQDGVTVAAGQTTTVNFSL